MKLVWIIGICAAALACGSPETEKPQSLAPLAVVQEEDSTAYLLLKFQCFTCHNPAAPNHDALLAPPMEAVKRRYLALYPDRDSFIEKVAAFSAKPDKKTAVMYGAVKEFKLMPQMAFQPSQVQAIAEWMYDHELERPSWFEAHFQEAHPQGMGGGQGKP